MTPRLTIDPRSLAQFTGAMAQLPRNVGIRKLRIALNAWGGIVKQEAAARVPAATRLLKRSLAVRVVIPDASWNVNHHGRPSRVIVGARRRFAGIRRFRALKSGKLKSRTVVTRVTRAMASVLRGHARFASRYHHLVEKHQPYIAPAQRAGNTRGLAKFRQKLGQGIEEETRKLYARQAARIR